MSTASIDTVYLVTGVNRGIGKCIVESLLFRSNTTVIGTMRTVNDRTCAHLHELPKAKGSKLIFVAMEMSRPDSITDAVAGLENIDKIDVVIANAAIARIGQSVADISVEEMLDHFQTNTIGPLVLYQRTKPLLAKSSNAKFAVISSAAASVSIQANFPYNHTSYSVSKGALNIIGARLAVEEKDKTIILMLHPGAVHTDMWQSLLVALDVPFVDLGFPMLTAEESAAFVLKTIDDATHADSGRFINATTGDTIPW